MPRTRDAAETALAGLRSELENQSTRLTQIASEIRGLSLNSVLLSELVEFPATGRIHRDTSTPYASVGLWAYDGQVTSDSGGEGAAAPNAGIGVIEVPAGGAVVWPLVGTGITLYGTAGHKVLLALWSKPQCPLVAGAGAISGGGA